jgi:hypothetical protein
VGFFSVNDAEGLSTSLQRKISSTSKEEEDLMDVSPMLRKKSSTLSDKKQEEKVYQSENLKELIKVLELTDSHTLLENLNKE